MSKRDEHDVAEALLAKAIGDEAGLRALVDNHDVPDHVAGFLAQQAIEKALKATLTRRDVAFERSHDIDYLCGLIEDAGLDLNPKLKAAVALTPWAVEFRYANPFDAPPLDRVKALETVVAVREWATRVIGAEEPAEPQADSSSEAEPPTADQ
ncbi:MAG TPA: HEPN domain-containing protein [Solirubrobacteraceae bacterium]|nr:HEPN domain-containing protein [Solirubrobacteraceae bacterium]